MASLLKNLADKYDSATEYVVGDRVVRNGHMYICTADTTGEFDSESWEEIYLADMLRGTVNSNLSKSNYFVTSDRSFKISKTTKKVLIIWPLGSDMLMEKLDLTNTSSWNRTTIRNSTSIINKTYDNDNSWTYENDTITLLSLVNAGYKMFVIEL